MSCVWRSIFSRLFRDQSPIAFRPRILQRSIGPTIYEILFKKYQYDSKNCLDMRSPAHWSIEAVGGLLAILSVILLVWDPKSGIDAIFEIAIPVLVSAGFIAFGRLLAPRSIIVHPRDRLFVATGHLAGGVIFCLVLLTVLVSHHAMCYRIPIYK